jgi:hypothetical protein
VAIVGSAGASRVDAPGDPPFGGIVRGARSYDLHKKELKEQATCQRHQQWRHPASGDGRFACTSNPPGHVENRPPAPLARKVSHLVAQGVVKDADVDSALPWRPGRRWVSWNKSC